MYPESFNNQRQSSRVNSSLPIHLNVDTQITMKGELKDLSSKSVFVRIKTSVYLQVHDELDFVIKISPNDSENIKGRGRISRIAPGEGFALYFVEMNDESASRFSKLVDQTQS